MGILEAADFSVQSTYHRIKDNSPGQIVFGQDIIIPVKDVVYWKLIRKQKKAQIEKDVTTHPKTIINDNYRVGDQVLLKNKAAYIQNPT